MTNEWKQIPKKGRNYFKDKSLNIKKDNLFEKQTNSNCKKEILLSKKCNRVIKYFFKETAKI